MVPHSPQMVGLRVPGVGPVGRRRGAGARPLGACRAGVGVDASRRAPTTDVMLAGNWKTSRWRSTSEASLARGGPRPRQVQVSASSRRWRGVSVGFVGQRLDDADVEGEGGECSRANRLAEGGRRRPRPDRVGGRPHRASRRGRRRPGARQAWLASRCRILRPGRLSSSGSVSWALLAWSADPAPQPCCGHVTVPSAEGVSPVRSAPRCGQIPLGAAAGLPSRQYAATSRLNDLGTQISPYSGESGCGGIGRRGFRRTVRMQIRLHEFRSLVGRAGDQGPVPGRVEVLACRSRLARAWVRPSAEWSHPDVVGVARRGPPPLRTRGRSGRRGARAGAARGVRRTRGPRGAGPRHQRPPPRPRVYRPVAVALPRSCPGSCRFSALPWSTAVCAVRSASAGRTRRTRGVPVRSCRARASAPGVRRSRCSMGSALHPWAWASLNFELRESRASDEYSSGLGSGQRRVVLRERGRVEGRRVAGRALVALPALDSDHVAQ